MRYLLRVAIIVVLFFSFSSFHQPANTFAQKLELCEAVKMIVQAFEEVEIDKLLEGKIIMGDETQWSSKITIKGFKDQYVYYDGPRSYFEAVLDKNIKSTEQLNREIYYIASVLQTCLKINMKQTSGNDEIMYEYATDDVSLIIWGKKVSTNDRSITIEIGFE